MSSRHGLQLTFLSLMAVFSPDDTADLPNGKSCALNCSLQRAVCATTFLLIDVEEYVSVDFWRTCSTPTGKGRSEGTAGATEDPKLRIEFGDFGVQLLNPDDQIISVGSLRH